EISKPGLDIGDDALAPCLPKKLLEVESIDACFRRQVAAKRFPRKLEGVFKPLNGCIPCVRVLRLRESIPGIFDTLRLNNVVDLTAGATLEFGRRTTLGVGLVVPVTGPPGVRWSGVPSWWS